ncbi:MAG: bifunctional 3,4-dihydroxy-2-butanone-4-phosphate synthase/GTP cyclohydrolase II [Elusimicrobiota bacterium]|nr:bifunctional 3,4-dihydroxy-2-butanone-4-phosphate synthase/GTP cyclohydrolase II [Elusimicrobiota bacterium]
MAVKFSNIDDAVKDYRQGKLVVIVDDAARENEGDLVCAASKISSAKINFMAKHGRGLICVAMKEKALARLNLNLLSRSFNASNPREAAFTLSCDAAKGVSTGISAADRARAVKALVSPSSKPSDIVSPGHIFPLQAQKGGTLVRAGHTEAAVDMSKLAGLNPSGVICEIMNDDGTMARLPDLVKFSAKHKLRLISLAQIIEKRRQTEKLVERVAEAKLPTRFGEFTIVSYRSKISQEDFESRAHAALVKGDVRGKKKVLVRVHSQCLTGDTFHSLRCDCGSQLDEAMKKIEKEKLGVLLYMRQEGRGIGLENKIKAYALQDGGMDTVEANEALGFEADLRDYGIGAQILADLGLTTIKLMTNNPQKVKGLGGFGLKVAERVPLSVKPGSAHCRHYLNTKKEKLGHLL